MARTALLTIEVDGERVVGSLRDEAGSTSAFTGWLDLITAIKALATAAAQPALRD